MAKNKNKNKGVTAGDLFGKIGRNRQASERNQTAGQAQGEDEFDLIDAIDATSESDSDSDLDINALLKKYMPEYSDQADSDPSQQNGSRGGVLSALKQSAAEPDIDPDEKLIDALDSAFSLANSDLQPEPETKASGTESSIEDLARRMLGLSEDEAFEQDDTLLFVKEEQAEALPEKQGEASASADLQEQTKEESTIETEPAEPVLPSLSSLMSRMEDTLTRMPEETPESPAEPDEADGDDMLTELLPDPDDGEDELISLFESEKPQKRFGLFGRKKKKKPVTPEKLTDEENVSIEEAEESVSVPMLSFEGTVRPTAETERTEPADGIAETEEIPAANPAAEDEDFAPAAEAEEKQPEHGLFGGSRLDELMTAACEAELIPETAEEAAVQPTETEEMPEETPEEEPSEAAGEEPVSEEKLAELVREMEDNGETLEPDDIGFDPADLDLMVAFGYDQKEGKGYDKAKAFGDKLQARQEDASKNRVKLDREEFVDKTQTPAIRKEYKRRETGLWIRLLLCAVFTIALVIFENIGVITRLFTGSAKQFAGAFDPAVYPAVYAMVSLQLMLLACVCAYDEILYGLKWLFRGNPRPQTVTALLTFAGIVYSALTAHLTVAPDEPKMLNSVTAFAAMLTLISEIYNVKRERMNFRVVANKRPKHIVRRLRDEESEGETMAFADAANVCDVMKIEKTDFVEGFFARLQKPDPSTASFITCLMSITVAVAVLFGLFMKFRGGSGAEIARTIYAAMLMICPLSVFIAFAYPCYRANVAAKAYDSAIIGETSLEEYSNASIISFDDKNVFPSYSVKVQNIRIYNNARIDRVLYYAASAFAFAGGPLQDVFEVATRDMGISDNVKIFDTEAGFLATQVDGVNIIFGRYDALTSRGLEIDDRAAEEDVDVSDELEIMYMFRENRLVAKMYVKYVMDADIDPILKQFSNSGLYVCVRTFDPNIDERMIAKKLNMKKMPLKIVRYVSAEEVGRYEAKVDSGLVTCGAPKSLLQVISFCGKVLQSKKTNVALSVLSVLIGASILVLMMLANSLGSLSSLMIALYQILWLIIMSVSSRAFIR